MLSKVQRKMMELKNHKYGSVGEDENEPKSSEQRVLTSLLACGMALLVVGGAIALAVFFLRAQHMKHAPGPVIPTGTGSHQLDVASDCAPTVEGLVGNMCVSCLNVSTKPKVQPQNCPAGTYYDEEYTCSCVPCLKHNCCPGGDKMEECPTGSFQPNAGQKTCELAIVFGDTIEYKYKDKSLLNQVAPAKVSQMKVYDLNKCNGAGDLSDGIAFISGVTSNSFDENKKLSIQISVQSAGIKESKVLVNKLDGSQIAGYAAGVVYTCLRQNFVTTLGYVSASKITAANPKTRILQPNLQCKDSSPQIFAALSGIESLKTSANRLSLSLKSSVRSNDMDFVRPKVQFVTTTAVEKATAAVFAYCSSPTSVLSEGIIESGVFSGNSSTGVSNQIVTVTFRTPKKCKPTIALGLTGINAVATYGALAVNLELLAQTITSTSFQLKIAIMAPMNVQSIEGAYLATCGMRHSTQTDIAIKKVCSVPTN